MTLESTVGQGNRFSIMMPWRVDTQEKIPSLLLPALLPSLLIEGLQCVLVVEDLPAHAEQLVRYLQELALDVAVYPQGEGVLDYTLAIQPDVILLDLGLPKVSGWEVLTQLKSAPQTQAIPVVIVSVLDEPAQGLAQGAAVYLVKPISRERLRAALGQAVASRYPTPALGFATPENTSSEVGPLLLLVEDNELNVTTIADYLHVKGYRLAVAGNGTEALAQARALHPALILMDIQMPGMDGLEATRRLRAQQDPAVAATPVIALTALAMPGDEERCLAAGANAYVSKPVRLQTLLQVIEAQLKG